MSSFTTGFLRASDHYLCVSVFSPESGDSDAPWVIHVPAFAEEMNKCRPMVSRQARALAEDGFIVVVPDLYGTGDSEGEFHEATWPIWREDIEQLADWARRQGARQLILWGNRLGCLLAADVLRGREGIADGILMWQPVLNGKQAMTQFLRLRVAAGLISGQTETVARLHERCCADEVLEIAGYELSPAIYQNLQALDLGHLPLPAGLRVHLVNISSDADKPLPVPIRKLLERYRETGIECSTGAVVGDAFWMTQEITLADSLVKHSRALLSEWRSPGSRNSVSASHHGLTLAPLAGDREAVHFHCEGEKLVGILHRAAGVQDLGVLIVVGGPQYRVGSHRQFVQLADSLASAGLPALRFDYRGMGDSEGTLAGFEDIDADLQAAVDVFLSKCPNLRGVIIWGLCDAATAAASYAPRDFRVSGLVLVNPWVYSAEGAARAYLRHYYLNRLLSRSFWSKVFSGGFKPLSSAASFLQQVRSASSSTEDGIGQDSEAKQDVGQGEATDLVRLFSDSLERNRQPVLLLLSGNDLTAAEFKDAVNDNKKLAELVAQESVSQVPLPAADHTFSVREHRLAAELETRSWCLQLARESLSGAASTER